MCVGCCVAASVPALFVSTSIIVKLFHTIELHVLLTLWYTKQYYMCPANVGSRRSLYLEFNAEYMFRQSLFFICELQAICDVPCALGSLARYWLDGL